MAVFMEDQIGQIASLIGDPVRSKILWILLDGRAFTATELAYSADTSPQNASMHLAKLVQADFLCVEKQGRHRYYRYSRDEVAYAIEALAHLIPEQNRTTITLSTTHRDLKECRSCYDHLAGSVGVAITEQLLKKNFLLLNDGRFHTTPEGDRLLIQHFNMDSTEMKKQRRIFAKPCLDWTERRYHLSGALGAALLQYMLSADWLRKTAHSRRIVVTSKGKEKLLSVLNLSL